MCILCYYTNSIYFWSPVILLLWTVIVQFSLKYSYLVAYFYYNIISLQYPVACEPG